MNKLFKIQLLLFVLLLLLWNIFTPVLEGADESGHYCHADYIAHRNKLPNLNNNDGCFLVYQPLYYIILVPFIKTFNLPEFSSDTIKQNPHFYLLRDGQYAQFVHDKDEILFRWNKFQILIHLLRIISSLLAIGIFLIAWQASKFTFQSQIHRNLAMLLFFNPMFFHIFTTLTNVVLVTFLASAFIATEIAYLNKRKHAQVIILQGAIIGLGILTKISILPIILAYVILLFIKPKENIYLKAKEILIVLLSALFVSGWYLQRSLNLYDELLEINAARPYAGEWHWTLLERLGVLNFWNSFADTIFRTFWSGYGGLTINFPSYINLLILVPTLLVVYATLTFYKQANKQIKLALYYSIFVFLGLMVVNLKTSSMHAKDLFTAYIPFAFLMSFGFINLVPDLKKTSFNARGRNLILILSIYFLARNEIVIILKWFLNTIGDHAYVNPPNTNIYIVLFTLIIKIIITYLSFLIIISLFKKMHVNYNFVYKSTLVLSCFNILILIVSTYLFYFKFL